MKRMVNDLGFANLVVERLKESAVPEICISLEDKLTGAFLQDIALVGQAFNYKTGGIIENSVRCLVWADSDDESYTNEFVIEKYQGED